MTPTEARDLCAALNRPPAELARLFERNAEFLERLNSTAGAAIERHNARVISSLEPKGGAYGI